jgi:hypothetical protein
MYLFAVLIGIILNFVYRFIEIRDLTLIKSVIILSDVHKIWLTLEIGPTRGIHLSNSMCYETDTLPCIRNYLDIFRDVVLYNNIRLTQLVLV